MSDYLYSCENLIKKSNKLAEKYGNDIQLSCCIEEMSEVIKELVKIQRGKGNKKNLELEISDLLFTLLSTINILNLDLTSINIHLNNLVLNKTKTPLKEVKNNENLQ